MVQSVHTCRARFGVRRSAPRGRAQNDGASARSGNTEQHFRRPVFTLEVMAARAKPARDEQSAAGGIARFFIFDGDCGFCQKWAAWLERRVGTTVRFLPFQTLDDLARFGLTVEDVQSASYLIESSDAYRGGRGIARALSQSRGAWRLVGRFLDCPSCASPPRLPTG